MKLLNDNFIVRLAPFKQNPNIITFFYCFFVSLCFFYLGILIIIALLVPQNGGPESVEIVKNWKDFSILRIVTLFIWAFGEEYSRYIFILNSSKKLNSSIKFMIYFIFIENIPYFISLLLSGTLSVFEINDFLIARAPSVIAHTLFTIIVFYAVKYKKLYILFISTILHVIFNLFSHKLVDLIYIFFVR